MVGMSLWASPSRDVCNPKGHDEERRPPSGSKAFARRLAACRDPVDFVVFANRTFDVVKPARCAQTRASASEDPMRLSVFWTVGPGLYSDEVIREQLALLDSSGLAARAQALRVGAHDYYGASWQDDVGRDLRQNASRAYPWSPKLQAIRLGSASEAWWSQQEKFFEFYTLEGLWSHCQQARQPDKEAVLYIHTKGSTNGKSAWRHIMSHFTVQHFQDCVDQLQCGASTCGSNLANPLGKAKWNFPHYSGNFFWARCDYIRLLPNPQPKSSDLSLAGGGCPYGDPPTGRYLAEWWLMGSNRDYTQTRVYKNCWGSQSSVRFCRDAPFKDVPRCAASS
ncbi:unnamed protein product [Prorocentrum cordatum]|uniref:Uncharacterized protein n=1 Tax=Prorocentrum cordatum TaxID=2364126 RepID=A0ABN9P9S4_9DINO|nr:unnamed protein product [Polarella glacialis]